MLFQVLVLLFILLITSYLATQGWFSATLLLVSATFASILAGGLYEPMTPMFAFSPNFARGTAFLVVFLVSFVALRFTADIYVKGNIVLQVGVDRAGGAVVGLLTALVVTGTLTIGISLMPLGESVAGWNRYPGGIQDKETRTPLWLHPDDFVAWIYEMTLGRSMGGAYGDNLTFAQAHPDFTTELWGTRHKVQASSAFTISPSLFEKPKAWKTDVKGNEGYAVRMTVRKGAGDKTSADKDSYFRATIGQVRLVAVKESSGEGRQYYPVGYFDRGSTFTEFSNAEGRYQYFQDDYTENIAQTGTPEQVMIDFAFEVDSGFKPKILEVKGVRQNVEVEEAAVKADASEYPPQRWKADLFRMSVEAHDATKVIPSLLVWIAPPVISKNVADRDYIGPMSLTLEANYKLAKAVEPSLLIPSSNHLNSPAQNAMKEHLGPEPDFSTDGLIIPTFLWSSLEVTGSGVSNSARVRDTLETKLKPLFKAAKAPSMSTNNKGITDQIALPSGASYCLCAWYYDEKNTLYVWFPRIDSQARKTIKYSLTTEPISKRKNTAEEIEFTPSFVWPRR